jgi:hypothetical protein
MRQLAITLLSATSLMAGVLTAGASVPAISVTNLVATHQAASQRSLKITDGCSGTGCKYEELQDPLASSEDGKRLSPPDAMQDCQGQCAKPQLRLQLADPSGGGGGGHHEEPPADPLAGTANAKPTGSSASGLITVACNTNNC